MTNKVLESENKGYGFYGTINLHYSEEKTNKKWAEAFETLTQLSNKKPEEIRDYLDSRSGRKLADCCIDLRGAIKTVILKEYFKWIEDDLFECRVKELQNKNKTLFGTMVYDEINETKVIILYQGTKKERNGDYMKVMDINENSYITRMDFLTPID